MRRKSHSLAVFLLSITHIHIRMHFHINLTLSNVSQHCLHEKESCKSAGVLYGAAESYAGYTG